MKNVCRSRVVIFSRGRSSSRSVCTSGFITTDRNAPVVAISTQEIWVRRVATAPRRATILKSRACGRRVRIDSPEEIAARLRIAQQRRMCHGGLSPFEDVSLRLASVTMRTSRATLALALLVASAAVVSAVTPTYSAFTVKAAYDKSQTNVGTDATVNGWNSVYVVHFIPPSPPPLPPPHSTRARSPRSRTYLECFLHSFLSKSFLRARVKA